MFEHVVEQAALGYFEAVGYDIKRGADISPGADLPPLRTSYEEVVLLPRLRAALRRLNPDVPEEAISHVADVVCRPPHPHLYANNRWFHELLTQGVSVEYRNEDGETQGDIVRLFDPARADANDFLVVSQLTVQDQHIARRPDLVVFLNGMPLVVIELKDPTNTEASLLGAFGQIEDYKRSVPALFAYNEIVVLSDGDTTRVGSLTAGLDRFAPWRASEGSRQPTLEALVFGLLRPSALLDYVQSCIAFEEDSKTGDLIKRVGGYHQYRAVGATRQSCKQALRPDGDGRGGVVWHTQGSGKSFTMLMLAGALVRDADLSNPTIVMITDRNDLDDQLFATFAAGQALLHQAPEQATNRADLAAKLNRASGGVVFTTIQKFAEREGPISARANIVVIADEAHRSQYGFVKGGARWMREALPNAVFVGFTGTPIESSDRVTRSVFGEYCDIYDIQQALDDGATVKIFYEMKLIQLLPDQQGSVDAAEKLQEALEADLDGDPDQASITLPLAILAGASRRVTTLATEIVNHFEDRLGALDGKGMIVCMSRDICMDLYDEIIRLRPSWHDDDDAKGAIKVVMDAGIARDTQDDAATRIRYHGRTKARRDAIGARLKDPSDPLKLAIVCDMWLTGFDCPPLHTMYLDKPLAGHNLMQAIARVNRVFHDKPGGVVVDSLGLADQLRAAVHTYTLAGGEGDPVESIQAEAVPRMMMHYEELRDFFVDFDYSPFFKSSAAAQLHTLVDGANYVLGRDDGQRRFMRMVAGLSRAFSLAVPLPETRSVRDHLAYYQALRAAINKRLASDDVPDQVSASTLRQLVSSSVAVSGVIDLFEAAGLTDNRVKILSPEFLERIASLPQKNLALEALRRLLSDEIRTREKTNLVESRTFRQSLEDVMLRYSNRAITTAQVVDELISLARFISESIRTGDASGMSTDEIALYQALADNQSARELMADDVLKSIAKEVADAIKQKSSLDWTKRETVRADMRRTIRRLLARRGYPPVAQDEATQLIVRQAELMADRVLIGPV